jgi:hypothetical protein
LAGVTGKGIFRGDAGRVGLSGDSIGDVKTRIDIIVGVNITMTT